LEIELTFRRRDFEEVYYVNGQGSYTKDKNIKGAFHALLICAGILMLSIIYSLLVNNYDLFSIVMVITVIFLIVYINRALAIRKWRKQIKNYLNDQERYECHRLFLSDNSISINQDDKETILKWNNFNSATIRDSHIWLLGKENLLLPAKSMKKEEYVFLKTLVSEKLK
jgi:c-di-AMP phosphodiesterase-like protein